MSGLRGSDLETYSYLHVLLYRLREQMLDVGLAWHFPPDFLPGVTELDGLPVVRYDGPPSLAHQTPGGQQQSGRRMFMSEPVRVADDYLMPPNRTEPHQ